MRRLFSWVLVTGLLFSNSLFAETLYIYNWSEYFAPDTLSRFEKETGIKVVYDAFDSNQILEAKLFAGSTGYDLVFPTLFPYYIRQVEAGIYQPLDPDKIPNLKRADPRFVEPLWRDGKLYGVPYLWGTVGIGYNRAKLTKVMGEAPVIDSWSAVFEPENLEKMAPCKVAFMDSPIYIYPVILNYLGLDPNSKNPDDYEKAIDVMRKIRPYITYFHDSQFMSDLANGNICVAVGWSGEMITARERALAAKNGVDIVYVNPKEGSLFAYDVITIPKDAQHVEAAYRFINFLLDPKVVADITSYTGYPNTLPESKKYIAPAIAEDKTVHPDEAMMKKLFNIEPIPLSLEKRNNRNWTKMKSGG